MKIQMEGTISELNVGVVTHRNSHSLTNSWINLLSIKDGNMVFEQHLDPHIVLARMAAAATNLYRAKKYWQDKDDRCVPKKKVR